MLTMRDALSEDAALIRAVGARAAIGLRHGSLLASIYNSSALIISLRSLREEKYPFEYP